MPYRRDSGTLKFIPYSLLQYQLIEQPREKLGNRGVMYEREKKWGTVEKFAKNTNFADCIFNENIVYIKVQN